MMNSLFTRTANLFMQYKLIATIELSNQMVARMMKKG